MGKGRTSNIHATDRDGSKYKYIMEKRVSLRSPHATQGQKTGAKDI